MAGNLTVGLAAHVDAGKTTLSEAMLFLSGTLHRQGRVAAVLDIDSPVLNRFSAEDAEGLERLARLTESRLQWD